MNDEEINRLRAFVLAVWTFTVTSLSAYDVKRGLDRKEGDDQWQAEDEDPGLPARSQGCTGAAEEGVVARRQVAMKSMFKIKRDDTLYTTKLGAELMDITCAPVTACRACKNAGRGEAPLVSRVPRIRLMGAQPSWACRGRVPKKRDGVAAGGLPGRGRRCLASGMGNVAAVMEGGRAHLPRCPTCILLGKKHNEYILYPIQEIHPLDGLHADRGTANRSLLVFVPDMGARVLEEFLPGVGVRNICIRGDAIATGFC